MRNGKKWIAVSLLIIVEGIFLLGKNMTKNSDNQEREYFLTGNGAHCEIAVGDLSGQQVVIHMKDYSLSGTEAPVLTILGTADVKLILEGENRVETVATEGDQVYPVIRAEGSLDISGDGSLTVNGVHQDGIRVGKQFSMNSGTLFINAGNNGIRSEDSIDIGGGTLHVRADNNGLKAQGKQKEDNGMIRISGGELHVLAGDDALEAGALVQISGGKTFLDAEDYLIHCNGEQELSEGCVFYEKQ